MNIKANLSSFVLLNAHKFGIIYLIYQIILDPFFFGSGIPGRITLSSTSTFRTKYICCQLALTLIIIFGLVFADT